METINLEELTKITYACGLSMHRQMLHRFIKLNFPEWRSRYSQLQSRLVLKRLAQFRGVTLSIPIFNQKWNTIIQQQTLRSRRPSADNLNRIN